MTKKKKKKGGDAPPSVAHAAPGPTAATVDAGVRLLALRERLARGDVDDALTSIDTWLNELGVPLDASEPVDRPLVSVLMACFNRAHLVGEAIESVLSQSYADFEYVIVDDGSTDGSPDVVRSYEDPRIRLFVNDRNLGRSHTRSRAIRQARGDYVLWMADDDTLVPGVLAMYVAQIAAHPETDVFYGNLMLFEGDRDLRPYEPNDWTGRRDRLLGASLVGSCVPDGGSILKRDLYERVGYFDPEYVRAQDYEFWTRAVAVAEFRKVDQIVYRYRKHDGNVSFGPTIDLSYDSKIIRRLLTRHPLSDFYLDDDWSQPEAARTFAYVRVARALLLYKDGYNAARFVRAAPGHLLIDDAMEALFEALLVSGRTTEAAEALDQAEANRTRPSRALEALRVKLVDATARRDDIAARLAAGDLVGANDRLAEYLEAYQYTLDGCYLHAQVLVADRQLSAALHPACMAARLDPEREDTLALAVRLREATGATSHKVDVESSRARLLERIYTFETDEPPLPTDGPRVTVMVCTDDPAPLESLRRQTYSNVEIVPAQDRNAALEVVTGDYVAWLLPDAVWHPYHLSVLVGCALRDEARVVCSESIRVRTDEAGAVVASYPMHVTTIDADHLLARDLMPLTCVLHARDTSARFADLPAHADWDFVIQLARESDVTHCHAITAEVPVVSAPRGVDPERRRALQRVYRRYEKPTLFNGVVRDGQAAALSELGACPAPRGTSNVVVLATLDVETTRACVDAVLEHTWVPYSMRVIADGGGEPMADYLRALGEAHEEVKVRYNPRPLGPTKVRNEGLSGANGDFVALVDGHTVVSDGWLGRMQWWVVQAPQTGVVVSGSGERLDGRLMLLTRGVLDRAGGFDTTLRGCELDDFQLRAAAAGYEVLGVDDVPLSGGAPAPQAGTSERFEARWGFAPPAAGPLPAVDEPYERARHYVHFGAEEGFRADTRPLRVDEAAARNILVVPPWEDEAALTTLVGDLGGLETDVAFWLRSGVGEGAATVRRLERIAGGALLPSLLVVDARLAPEREAALYVTADAVYVDDVWPEADAHARRASDCGRPVLRGLAELRAWLGQA